MKIIRLISYTLFSIILFIHLAFAANVLANLVRVSTATTGTGTITLGSAITGLLTFAQAGITDGQVVTYSIHDGVNSEIGSGTYTASGTTLSRDTVYRSTGTANTGKISLSGNAQVTISISKEDMADKASLTTVDQTLSGGANVTAVSLGTKSSGTLTIDCGTGPLQYYTNGGAHTFAAPSNDGSCIIQSINNGSAGAITFSGFTVGSSTGDALTTTNTQKFAISVFRINGTSGYRVAAYQ